MILAALIVLLTYPGSFLSSDAGIKSDYCSEGEPTQACGKACSKVDYCYEGMLTVSGLSDTVTIYRDERGMPHIYASNEHDLYLAVGYVSAQERLWQMDLIRRSTTGRLSEIFGKSFLQADIISRCLRMTDKSGKILENEDPSVIACMQAYIEGINFFILNCKKLPLEFRLLSYRPEPWSLEDIVNIIGLMGWSLGSRNLTAELFNYQLVRKTGAEKASSLIPDWDLATEIVYPDFVLNDTLISEVRSLITSFDRIISLGVPLFSGSNNWAVSGERSATGKPLLSNDMHLPFNIPSIWIQMHHIVPGKINVTGVVIPGEPFIVAGHNDKIAWGMTNLMVDDIDLYTERINPENHDQYYFNGQWKDLIKKTEIINIRGGKQIPVTIGFTHRGPVISGLINPDNMPAKIKWMGYDYLAGLEDLKDLSLSFRWSGFDISDEIKGIYLLNRAQNWEDFRSGVALFNSTSHNFIYSDIYGNIGLNAGGGIPLRKGNGIMIRNGETDEYDWRGYVPFDQMPFSFNPPDGNVSSANNKTVAGYPYFISQDFVVPYRIERIREMLGQKELFSTEDFKRMITDQQSVMARLLTPFILKLKEKRNELSQIENAILDSLSAWDFIMDPSRIAPSVFEFFRICLKKNLFADDLGDLFNEMYYMTSEYYIYRLITGEADEWIDNLNTPEKETLDDIVMESFKDAIEMLSKQYGKNPARWQWGRIHTITFIHPLGSVKILGSLFKLNSGEYPTGGSDHTVCPFSFKAGFRVSQGASIRHIFNTADWDQSYSVLPGGISGVPKSEFYLSQVEPYLEGRFYNDHFSEKAVKNSAKHRFLLRP